MVLDPLAVVDIELERRRWGGEAGQEGGKGKWHQWRGEADQAGGKGRRCRWGGEAEQAGVGAVRLEHRFGAGGEPPRMDSRSESGWRLNPRLERSRKREGEWVGLGISGSSLGVRGGARVCGSGSFLPT
jgi:hypothetical protein